ncbi:hypothetical protein ACT6NV_00555 [Robiginitalea sp. IMCC44478]|uniref:hypothetical protein n=1 Tax=Robiginitalea sp. IMCC44478 TaxID=3459122 RepID=UPI00404116A7
MTTLSKTLIFQALRGVILLSFLGSLHAQTESEIYLAGLEIREGVIRLDKPINISNNAGYDNQPSFLNEGELLYSRTRNGQTDIARYTISDSLLSWVTNTPVGSEYSPLKIPHRNAVSAIRLDTSGLQRLYSYKLSSGKSKVLLEDQKVGYHLWYSKDLLVCTVLTGEGMNLVVANLKDHTVYTFQKGVGRSLQRIPGSDRISYTAVENGQLLLKSMDPRSGATDPIVQLPEGSQDICWLPDGQLLCGYQNMLLSCRPGKDMEWQPLQEFPEAWGTISRMALSPAADKLAFVVSPKN